MTTKATQTLDKKLFADLQLTDEVIANDYAADGTTVVGTARIPVGDLLRKGIVVLDAPLATVNSANTVSVAGPILGQTTDDQLVVKLSQTDGVDGWVLIVAAGSEGIVTTNILLEDATGIILEENVLGRVGGRLVLGNGTSLAEGLTPLVGVVQLELINQRSSALTLSELYIDEKETKNNQLGLFFIVK